MKTLYYIALAALSISLLMSGFAEARSVYLKDGAILQAEAAWRSDGRVIVLVNHEEELSFSESEINLQKTFPKHAAQKKTPSRQKQAAKAPVMAGMSSSRATASGQIPASKATTSTKKESAGTVTAPPLAGQSSPSGKPVQTAPAPNSANASAPPAAAKPGPPIAPTTPKPAETVTQPAKVATTPVPPPPSPPSVATPQPEKHPLPGAASPLKKLPALSMTAIFAIVGGALLLVVLMIVSYWKVYEKAGQAGWKSLIPIYNMVVLLNIIDKPVWWVILLFVPLVQIIITFIIYIELAKRFGKGLLFGLGLIFLSFIFFPLLAFGDATYE